MRKTTLAVIGGCAAASLLFFLAPVFRQAFRASLTPWYYFICSVMTNGRYQSSPDLDAMARLEALVRRAEQNQDAEGIAFVAMQLWNDESESARLADEAVRLDPKLTWVYAAVPGWWSSPDRWVKLQKYDPQNALPYFIAARQINYDLFVTKRIIPSEGEEPAAWRNAMEAAFQSPKFDNYCAQVKELDRRVVLRYGFDDPNRFLDGPNHLHCRGSLYPGDSWAYAKSVLKAGELLEAQGDRKGAREKYWAVARFGQMLGSARSFLMTQELQEAYKHLETLSEKQGKPEQAELYAYLAGNADKEHRDPDFPCYWCTSGPGGVSRWNGFLARISSLTLLFSAGLLLACLCVVMVRGRSLRLGSLRPGRLTLTLGTCGSVGLLLSSAILYATYKPYAGIFQRYLHTGDESEMREFVNFLAHAQSALGATEYWVGQVALCLIALFIVLTRSVVKHLRARAA